MMYHQITFAERYTLGVLRRGGLSPTAIARTLGRHRSTILREVQRNQASSDGTYRPQLADWYAPAGALTPDAIGTSPPRSGHRSRRCSAKIGARSKWRAGSAVISDSRSVTKRSIVTSGPRSGPAARSTNIYAAPQTAAANATAATTAAVGSPASARSARDQPAVETRRELGHWEADTVLGASQAGPCVLSLVERKTGYLLLGQLRQRISAAVNHRAQLLIATQPHPVQTITVDNGTEFHDYAQLERVTAARFYFATPHHAWERGTNENTNGLVRQYLPKRQSMAHLTQHDCNRIAAKLNRRPRKRLGYRTPEECYAR